MKWHGMTPASISLTTSATFWYDQILTGVCRFVVGLKFVAVLLFATRIAGDFVVNVTSSCTRSQTRTSIKVYIKKSYS